MPKKGENIYKRKDGRWEGRYIRSHSDNGKAVYGYVYAKTYAEVKLKLFESKIALQNQNQCKNSTAAAITYSELLDDWLQFVKLNIKESTYSRYKHLINTHIKPQLGEQQICHLTTNCIEQHIMQLLYNGRLDGKGGLAAKTVTDILTIIKSTIEYSDYKGYATTCNLKKLTVKKSEKEMRVLSLDEQNRLVKTLTFEMDLSKFGVLLALYTGIRIGELCALKWEDINLSQATLKIRKTIQRIQNTENKAIHKTKIIITEPKSQCSLREIPLPNFLVDYAGQFVGSPQAYVLTGDINRYIEPRAMQNKFKKYICESGIAETNFHALRHTFATRCVEVGFEIKSLSEILGHANVNITLNRYVHSSFELKCSNMNKLTLNF